LNDYFDCNAQMFEFDESSIRFLLSQGAVPRDVDKLIQSDPIRAQKITRNTFNEILYIKIGIISMTEDPANLLMWSYYTNHQGFQVEFDYSKLPFKKHGPFPINYCKELEKIRISRNKVDLGVLMQTNIKYHGWEHEKEWRVLGEKENMVSPNFSKKDNVDCEDRKFRYESLSVVKSIKLGIRFFIPGEIYPINGYTLKITLAPKNVLKRKLLNFISKNEIETCVPISPELNQLIFIPGHFQKISELEYVFTGFEDLSNPPLTLHEAMIKLLNDENRILTAKEIACALNQNGWYKKADGSLIKTNQIHARKNKYPDLFEVDKSVRPMKIGLKQ